MRRGKLDFRLKENRREAFIRWYVWGLRTTDCDPAIGMMNYIFKRQELNREQRYWMAWLYGCTYYLPTAYLIYNEFPDYENVDLERLTKWNTENYRRLRYQTDTKYNKGYLPEMFKSYRDFCGGSQHAALRDLSYEAMRESIMDRLYKFGRYTAWFYMQALQECCGMQIEPSDLLLGKDGSESHTNGLCYALGEDDQVSKFYEGDKRIKREVSWDVPALQYRADGILSEIRQRFPEVTPGYYTMETALCSFKKLFRAKEGRYLGYYLDRQAEEIRQLESDGWPGVDWNLLWDYRAEKLHPALAYKDNEINKVRMRDFLECGDINGLSLFEDLAN